MYEGHWLSRIDEYPQIPRLYFGLGAITKLAGLAEELAENERCIIITDAVLSKIGLVKEPKKILEGAGFSVNLHEGEPAEPRLDEVKRIIEAVRAKKYGLVVGIGGGSAMDKAKMAATMAKTPGDLEEYVCPSTKSLAGSVPTILIPTTSGTGSECSNTAVVIVPHKEMGAIKTWITGNQVLADAAIIDPALTISVPPRITAGSGMDAMSHSAEAILSIQANPFSDAIALQAVELVSENLRTAYHQGNNIEARWNMALAAAIGGMVISYPWVAGPATLGHVVSEGISAKYGVPHGEACGVLLPFVYEYNLVDTYGTRKIARIAKAMGEDVSGLGQKEAAYRAISATFDLLEDINLPTSLKDYGVLHEDIPALSEYILQRSEKMYHMSQYNPVKATVQNLRSFLEKALQGREGVE